MSDTASRIQRNVRLYPAYQSARHALFWLPIFFLYFSSVCTVEQVLALEGIYYGCVVLLEVPSGYLSDRWGRRPTLIAASVATLCAHLLFALGASFWTFAGAQALLAAGMAFNSGTDSTLLYESLAHEGDEESYGRREGRAQSMGLATMAVASLFGGGLALLHLRFAYVASACAAAAGVLLCLAFVEPSHQRRARAPIRQLGDVARALRKPALAWVFAYVVVMTVLNHVPYELVQPWVMLMLADVGAVSWTPVLTGAVAAVTMFLSALGSRWSMELSVRLGLPATLLGMTALQITVIGIMGLTIHPVLLALLLLRGIPGAVMLPVTHATVLPELDAGLRATHLSVQSLAGRLAFSAALFASTTLIGPHDQLTVEGLQSLTTTLALAAIIAWLALALFVRAVNPSTD